MFSSAFKSFTSNISSNYEISKQSSATVGTWTVFDAKKKSTGAPASVFVFDRKALDINSGGFGARATSSTSIRKIQDEVVERLKKEASSLARLRHPSVLQLVEPLEETRSGGLMFATESVLCSLSAALAQKDRAEGRTGRGLSRSVSDDGITSRASQDVELDELEVQKGLLQVAKGLEFLHDSAKLVHGNLTPDTIMINAKSDWKISGLGFAGPPDGAEGHQTVPQISLSEVLYHDSRIPRIVQLDLDYTSPDFVLDSNINFSADIFSLGLVILACYRKPHRSPIEVHGNQATYKKIFSNASNVPSSANNYLSEGALPRELNVTLPRMLARRPAQRLTATEFQQSEYFDNILVNTMRFLDAFPAKTPAEKSQFMKGLGRVMPQFPPSVLGKKILSVLLDEMKDRDLLPLIMQNIFQIIKVIPSSKEVVSDKILPRMREIFLSKSKSEERDTSKEAALLAVLNNIQLIADNCSARQFKDDVLPIIHVAMESSTHSITDAALQSLSVVLPLIDFSTVKHDLFPVVANVFSKTSSLAIKVRGLEALGVLCGVSTHKMNTNQDDLSGSRQQEKPDKNVSSLDKFTMQEKVVPLLKAIKTKEPGVMMAALKVFRQVGTVADTDFLAIEVMPILWSFCLGPLLELSQFKAFMDVIKELSAKIEREQIRKLQELSSSRPAETRATPISHTATSNGTQRGGQVNGPEEDFEKLVIGNKTAGKNDVFAGALSEGERLTPNPPSFSWSSMSAQTKGPTFHQNISSLPALQPQPTSRSITPDVGISAFPSLQPQQQSSASAWAASSQPSMSMQSQSQVLQAPSYVSRPANPLSPPPASSNSSWQLPPPPGSRSGQNTALTPGISAPPQTSPQIWQQRQQPNYNIGMTSPPAFGAPMNVLQPQTNLQPPSQPKKTGLDKYESLL
ncbi:Protein kinase domain-containing protein ppk32 [Exophiala xenobiotica]|nr:Protein kinase domain-containing protein ppk32 [Exophiala xenobiotica]KAK5203684.1 Protein kinase domain-containing protein ppk32 [Exophiala xenobiotica]KAK5227867.1 Protein kinase domain-containing protein ppk32 [Exophiala xenobiotica]KAK5253410.1 Protein kinase domain-containing protein ppk32 [Exophiala xenobiotica]KAK5346686.1 Protein kinase domain-containing protein ppk32 [Exophiala xenobiotica]